MSDYDELKARLRKADEYEPLGHDGWEAADAITTLQARVERAEANYSDLQDMTTKHQTELAKTFDVMIKRAEAAEAALVEARTVQAAAKVLLAAMERAQVSMEILRKLHNGEPVVALRALAKGEEA